MHRLGAHRHQSYPFLVQPSGAEACLVGFVLRNAQQAAVVIITPEVIEACESASVAALIEDELGGAMSAGVVKRADFALAVSTHDDRLLTDDGGDVVARPRNLALVADEIPYTKEDLVAFDFEDPGVRIDPIVDEIFVRQRRFDNSHGHLRPR